MHIDKNKPFTDMLSLHQQGYTSLEFAQTFLCVIFNTFKYNALINKKKKRYQFYISFYGFMIRFWDCFDSVILLFYILLIYI